MRPGPIRLKMHVYSRTEGKLLLEGDSFWGRLALKLAVTTLVCIKLVINLWRFVPPEKRYYKKRPVYAVDGHTRSLKSIFRKYIEDTISCLY